jgi:hypothetical protein
MSRKRGGKTSQPPSTTPPPEIAPVLRLGGERADQFWCLIGRPLPPLLQQYRAGGGNLDRLFHCLWQFTPPVKRRQLVSAIRRCATAVKALLQSIAPSPVQDLQPQLDALLDGLGEALHALGGRTSSEFTAPLKGRKGLIETARRHRLADATGRVRVDALIRAWEKDHLPRQRGGRPAGSATSALVAVLVHECQRRLPAWSQAAICRDLLSLLRSVAPKTFLPTTTADHLCRRIRSVSPDLVRTWHTALFS